MQRQALCHRCSISWLDILAPQDPPVDHQDWAVRSNTECFVCSKVPIITSEGIPKAHLAMFEASYSLEHIWNKASMAIINNAWHLHETHPYNTTEYCLQNAPATLREMIDNVGMLTLPGAQAEPSLKLDTVFEFLLCLGEAQLKDALHLPANEIWV